MNNNQKFIISLLPLVFAIVAIIFCIISMFNSSSTIPLAIGLIFFGLTYISSFITKKIVKDNPNGIHFIIGLVILVIGILALLLAIL